MEGTWSEWQDLNLTRFTGAGEDDQGGERKRPVNPVNKDQADNQADGRWDPDALWRVCRGASGTLFLGSTLESCDRRLWPLSAGVIVVAWRPHQQRPAHMLLTAEQFGLHDELIERLRLNQWALTTFLPQ